MSEDRPSPGRIFVFMVVVVAFFVVVASVLRLVIEGVSIVPDAVNSSIPVYVQHGRPMHSLYTLARAVLSWLVDVFRSGFGIAIVLLITVVYMVLTER